MYAHRNRRTPVCPLNISQGITVVSTLKYSTKIHPGKSSNTHIFFTTRLRYAKIKGRINILTELMSKVKLPRVLIIVGPTASGKTALALDLAKKFNGEIVSADSRQIYKGMDIGTAKAPKSELDGVKHYVVDIKKPNQDYSVVQFKKDAIKAINKILKSGRLPIIVGGTGLYVSAVVDNLDFPKVIENKKLRQRLEDEIKTKGLDFVFKRLVELDPEAAYIVDPKNSRRVIRALEVALITGKPFTAQRKKLEPLFDCLEIGITKPDDELKEKIAERIKIMITDGLVDEVGGLVKKYGQQIKALDAIGYREIIDYLNNKATLEQAAELMTKNTWHYAKRQMTWFRKDKNIKWIKNIREAEKLTAGFIKNKA